MAFFSELMPVGNGQRNMILIVALVVIILFLGILAITNTRLSTYLPSFLQRYIAEKTISEELLKLWKSGEVVQFTGLVASQDTYPDLKRISSDIYTVSVEMIWYNTRTMPVENAPFRHILHRGSSIGFERLVPINIPNVSCNARGQFATLPAKGLPAQMNPGIFADPITNDLCIFITTTPSQTLPPQDVTVHGTSHSEMIRVSDIPLDKPFSLKLIMQKNYVEVYIDCRLEVTKILKHMPITLTNKSWYGLSGNANLMAQIQNLTLWNSALPSNLITKKCPTISFTAKRPTCPGPLPTDSGSGSGSASESATSGPGYGNSLSIC